MVAAGAKGANLGELAAGGFPVPPGFVLTTPAYDAFVHAHGLRSEILGLAETASDNDPRSTADASEKIKHLIVSREIGDDIAVDLLAAYAELGEVAVAVRSSGTAEDLPQASFAGQHETLLNVRGPQALLAAVKECWASMWTTRAMAYRKRMGIDHEGVTMAIVVQRMVPAEISGVLFTANPTTGARDELAVNASFGLAEAIVSGQVTPDTHVLDRPSGKEKERIMGTKAVMIVAAGAQGTATQPVPEAWRDQAALSDEALAELAALGMRVEQHFDRVPQDIEWAVADGHVWLLQARPITNLPSAPLREVRWEPLRPGTIWMRRQVVEHMPEPLSPLFDELYLQQGLDRSMEEMAAFLSDLSGVEINLWDFIDPPFAATINGYAYSTASFKFSWQLVPTALRIYTAVLPKMIRHLVPRWRDESLPRYRALTVGWKELDLARASDQDLLQGICELAQADAVYWFAAAIPLGLARMADVALDRFLKSTLGGRDSVVGSSVNSGSYLRGFPSKAISAQIELEGIARTISASEELRELVINTPAPHLLQALARLSVGEEVRHDLGHYLDEYGHQIYDLDFATPTLEDDPLPVLLSLKAAVVHPEQDARARQARMAQEREALVARTERSLNPLQRRLFHLLLGWAQRYTPIREEALFYVGAGWPALRRLALELGRRLTDAGSLSAPDDVFYLKTAELAAASVARADGADRPDLARLADERRQLRSARRRLEPPAVVPPGGRLKFGPIDMALFEPQPRRADAGPTLNGFAVSPGRITAPASIVRSPEDFDKMMPDTVLVCPTTTPAWTPLFAQASGLVTDIGGALAHGSIVAREYGIPAVMGTGVATQRIESGQRILVDGDHGTVTPEDEDEGAGRIAQAQVTAQERAATARKRKALIALALGTIVALVAWRRTRRARSNS